MQQTLRCMLRRTDDRPDGLLLAVTIARHGQWWRPRTRSRPAPTITSAAGQRKALLPGGRPRTVDYRLAGLPRSCMQPDGAACCLSTGPARVYASGGARGDFSNLSPQAVPCSRAPTPLAENFLAALVDEQLCLDRRSGSGTARLGTERRQPLAAGGVQMCRIASRVTTIQCCVLAVCGQIPRRLAERRLPDVESVVLMPTVFSQGVQNLWDCTPLSEWRWLS